MKKRMLMVFASLLFAILPVAVFAATGVKDVAKANPGKSIAVVSLSANNYGKQLQGWNDANTSDLMASKLNLMLAMIENNLSGDWKVVKAETFVKKDKFQALAGDMRDVGVPDFDGSKLPLFGTDRKQMVKARIDPELAKKIAAVTGTDFIVIIYSEWAVAEGSMIPTNKALTKNVMSIYDKDGKQVFTDRIDRIGKKTLGALGIIVVDEDTIDQWVDAYLAGVTLLLNQ